MVLPNTHQHRHRKLAREVQGVHAFLDAHCGAQGRAGEEGRGSLRSGALEASNVNVVEELVDMIETQRAYEVSSKSITAVDEMMRYISNNL